MEITFRQLRKNNEKRDAEFRQKMKKGDEWTIVDRSNELAGEVGELCNLIKKIRRHNLNLTTENIPEIRRQIRDELADILITADLVAMQMSISLDQAIPDKFDRSSFKFGLETYWEEKPC